MVFLLREQKFYVPIRQLRLCCPSCRNLTSVKPFIRRRISVNYDVQELVRRWKEENQMIRYGSPLLRTVGVQASESDISENQGTQKEVWSVTNDISGVEYGMLGKTDGEYCTESDLEENNPMELVSACSDEVLFLSSESSTDISSSSSSMATADGANDDMYIPIRIRFPALGLRRQRQLANENDDVREFHMRHHYHDYHPFPGDDRRNIRRVHLSDPILLHRPVHDNDVPRVNFPVLQPRNITLMGDDIEDMRIVRRLNLPDLNQLPLQFHNVFRMILHDCTIIFQNILRSPSRLVLALFWAVYILSVVLMANVFLPYMLLYTFLVFIILYTETIQEEN